MFQLEAEFLFKLASEAKSGDADGQVGEGLFSEEELGRVITGRNGAVIYMLAHQIAQQHRQTLQTNDRDLLRIFES